MTRLWGSGRLPQGGESAFPLPQGLGGRCSRRWRGRRRTPIRPSGACRCLRSARRLSCRLPGGGRSRAHPRRCLLFRLRLWARGAKAPTSRGESVPHRSPPPPRSTTNTPKSPGRRVPAARAAETPHSSVPGAPVAGSSSPCVPPAPAPAAALCACVLGLGAWAGRTARRSRSRAAEKKRKVRPRRHVAREWRERRRKLYSPAGPRGA
jgi:hypothetical protein